MNDETSTETTGTEEGRELLDRRLFLQSMGKWSGAAIAAVVFGGAWLASPPSANAAAWVNRRGGGGGGWVNRCRWGRWGMDKRWRWRWGMGQPPWLWRRRCMGQSLIGDFTGHICVSYSPTWNDVLRTMFGGSLGTSIDYPSVHCKLFRGAPWYPAQVLRSRPSKCLRNSARAARPHIASHWHLHLLVV